MKLQESGENYLETILILQKRKGFVRSIDIASELNYSKPSISRAIGILKKNQYITVEEGGKITFTEKGLLKATEIYNRHAVIKRFFMYYLGVDELVASQDACRIEHIISAESLQKMKEKVEKLPSANVE